jgi:proline iminopeptidase
VPSFPSHDGTEISYRVAGDGRPLVCLPGGPGRSSEYLGDLGGLSRWRQLVLMDPRGVGLSAVPADPATLRVDRLVDDVESLRVHLGLERMDLLAHSAGAALATLYAAAHPDRLAKLVLVTPGLDAVGVDGTEEQLRGALARRAAEPWYSGALAALEQIFGGHWSMQAFQAARPFYYARWDDAAQAHAMAGVSERHRAAREGYFAHVSFEVPAIRAVLAKLAAPVLLYAGEFDPLVTPDLAARAATVFQDATVIVQPGVAHFPWVEDPVAFTAAISPFLS